MCVSPTLTQWRAVSASAMREITERGDDAPWTCSMRFPGSTCKSTIDDWAAIRRRTLRARAPAEAARICHGYKYNTQ